MEQEKKRELVGICAVKMNEWIVWMVETPPYEAHEGDLIEISENGRILTGTVIATMTTFMDTEYGRFVAAVAGKAGIRKGVAVLRRHALVYENETACS